MTDAVTLRITHGDMAAPPTFAVVAYDTENGSEIGFVRLLAPSLLDGLAAGQPVQPLWAAAVRFDWWRGGLPIYIGTFPSVTQAAEAVRWTYTHTERGEHG